MARMWSGDGKQGRSLNATYADRPHARARAPTRAASKQRSKHQQTKPAGEMLPYTLEMSNRRALRA